MTDSHLLEVLLDCLPTPVFFKDPQGRYRRVNDQFADSILGLPKDQIIGKTLAEVRHMVSQEKLSFYQDKETHLLERGGEQHYTYEVLCADGLERDFEFHKATVRDGEGEVLGTVGVMIDVTARRAAEAARLKAEKLKAAMQTAGAVCHELNQPLQVILSEVEGLRLVGFPAGEASEMLASIIGAINTIRDITTKLQQLTEFRTMAYSQGTDIMSLGESTDPIA